MENIHIYKATGEHYMVRARLPGYRKYEILGKATTSLRTAMQRLAKAMSSNDYKRGDVLLCSDYYDPLPLYEVIKR